MVVLIAAVAYTCLKKFVEYYVYKILRIILPKNYFKNSEQTSCLERLKALDKCK